MKLIIDIPEEDYKNGTLINYFKCYSTELDKIIYDGTPLESQPTDAISRQAVIDGIDRYIEKTQSTSVIDNFISFKELVIKHLPLVTPQRPKGKWIPIRNYQGLIVAYKCSKCEKTPRRRVKSNYCPNCGSYNGGNDNGDE